MRASSSSITAWKTALVAETPQVKGPWFATRTAGVRAGSRSSMCAANASALHSPMASRRAARSLSTWKQSIVAEKPVVQYVVEELARCGISRLLFVTGPGKTAIENHFDIDAELVANLRESGKEELLGELAFEREDLQYFYTRQRRQLGLGHAVLCARPVVGQQPFVVALGDSFFPSFRIERRKGVAHEAVAPCARPTPRR